MNGCPHPGPHATLVCVDDVRDRVQLVDDDRSALDHGPRFDVLDRARTAGLVVRVDWPTQAQVKRRWFR